jgi:beta-1,4-mannosyl-glycoprotein beta-1,4-N-acetylglucosaminyltransferase
MIYDIFPFFNEFDLLEIRLEILNPYVDYFVIYEANETFSGVPKPMHFRENRDRYKKWEDKIIYHEVTDVPNGFWDDKCDQQILGWARSSPNVTRENLVWLKEFYIKEHVRRTLEKILKPDDVCFISDLDEIWNPDYVLDCTRDVVYKPKQLPYLYYLNMRTDEDWLGWSGTICANWKVMNDGILNHLRTDELTQFEVVENGGWHFGTIGGKEKKMEASRHPFYNEAVWSAREKNMRIDESDLPEYLIKNKQKWIKLFAV